MSEASRITSTQRVILDYLKKNKDYLPISKIMSDLDRSRPTIHDHLQRLVDFKCVHKRPGAGYSSVYKWLRDEPLKRTEIDLAVVQDRSSISPGVFYRLAELFSQTKYTPKNHDKLPRSIATVLDELNTVTYGSKADASKLDKARKELASFYETLINVSKHVGDMLDTKELWDTELIGEYLEEVSEGFPLGRLTDMVDDIRNYNPEL